ncbi:hypothetical protein SSTU70S_01869 [Stutzerimonas stutzeri]
MAHPRAVAAAAEQAVQGACLVGQRRLDRVTDRQLGLGVADRLGHARRRLAGGRRQADGQPLAAGLFEQCREQAHHGGGLAGAGAAGNHRQPPAYRLRRGQPLPVRALLIEGEQPRQALAELRFIDRRPIAGTRQQLFGQLPLVGLVTGEVEPLAVEDQRRVGAGRADQRRGAQAGAPVGQRRQADIVLRPRPAPGQARQRQADIAFAQRLAAQRGGQQDRHRRRRLEALQAGDEGAFQRTQRQLRQRCGGVGHQCPSSNSRSSASSNASSGRAKYTPAAGMPRRNR